MKHIILGVALLIGGSTLSAMPVQAASEDSVVQQCTLAASGKLSGQCVGAAQSYLETIKSLPADQLDKNIADLVFKLGQLAESGPTCNVKTNGELGQAINLASSYSTTAEQKAQIELISTTISTCTVAKTASIGGPGFRGNKNGYGNGGAGNIGVFPGGGNSLGTYFGGAGHKPSDS